MPGKKNDLPNAAPFDQPDVSITYNELLEELAGSMERLPDVNPLAEVTIEMLATKMKISRKRAESLLEKRVQEGSLSVVMRNNPGNNHAVKAYVRR